MATATGRGDKVAFLNDLLGRTPEANHKEAIRAWKEAGHEGTISGSSFYRAKSDLGLSGRGRADGGEAAPKKSRPKAATGGKRAGRSAKRSERAGRSADVGGRTGQRDDVKGADKVLGNGMTQAGDRERLIDEVEAGIDELMFRLKLSGGMPEVEEALRAARRLLTRSQGE